MSMRPWLVASVGLLGLAAVDLNGFLPGGETHPRSVVVQVFTVAAVVGAFLLAECGWGAPAILLAGGALANLLDAAVDGSVSDPVGVAAGDWIVVFSVGDLLVVAGAGWLVWQALRRRFFTAQVMS